MYVGVVSGGIVVTQCTVWTLIFAVLNFRGLAISAFFASVLICASHISHIAKHVWAA